MIERIKKSKSNQKWLYYSLNFIFGFIAALYVALSLNEFYYNYIFVIVLGVYLLSNLLQIMIHEIGHMVFGLMTGYKFHSIRFLFFMFYIKDNKLKFMPYYLSGTAGQCIMIPPEPKYNENGEEEPFPYILYNLGGVIFNIISVPILIILRSFVLPGSFLDIFLFISIMHGIMLALINGIPIKLAHNNDGMNIIYLYKDKRAMQVLRLMLKAFVLNINGDYYDEMGEEFFLPQEVDILNPISAYIPMITADKALASGNFEEAKRLFESLISYESMASEFYKLIARLNLIYLISIGEIDKKFINIFMTKDIEKLFKKTSKNMYVLRTLYAYELLFNNNVKAAQKQLAYFEMMTRKSKFKNQDKVERRLFDYVNRKHEEIILNSIDTAS